MKVTAVREATVVVRKSGRVLLRQRAKGERWEGMWDFPRFPLDGEGPLFVRRELVDKVREQTGVDDRTGRPAQDDQARRHPLPHHARLLRSPPHRRPRALDRRKPRALDATSRTQRLAA